MRGGPSKLAVVDVSERVEQLSGQMERRMAGVRKGMEALHNRLQAIECAPPPPDDMYTCSGRHVACTWQACGRHVACIHLAGARSRLLARCLWRRRRRH